MSGSRSIVSAKRTDSKTNMVKSGNGSTSRGSGFQWYVRNRQNPVPATDSLWLCVFYATAGSIRDAWKARYLTERSARRMRR